MKYEWNEPFQLVMKIKHDYVNKYGLDTLCFETWLKRLNNEEYDAIFSGLQLNQNNEFLLLRYGAREEIEDMYRNKFSIYRECRSVVIDLFSEELVLTPFKKFFNLNEVEETNIDIVMDKIKNAKIIEITDKMDGSMQCARYYNKNFFMSGSKSLNKDTSWRLDFGYKMLTDNYKRMLKENEQYTFIFEFIKDEDAHVVNYSKEQEGLYLIGIRNVYTGEELFYYQVKEFSEKYNIPMAKIENSTIEEVMELSKTVSSAQKEGWVINIDGLKIKLKCDDYVKLHTLIGIMVSTNTIIQHIAENRYDDMMSKIPNYYKPRIQVIADEIFKYRLDIEEKICYNYNIAPKEDIKTFMTWVDNNCPKYIRGYVKCKYLCYDYNVLHNGGGGYKRIQELKIYE